MRGETEERAPMARLDLVWEYPEVLAKGVVTARPTWLQQRSWAGFLKSVPVPLQTGDALSLNSRRRC